MTIDYGKLNDRIVEQAVTASKTFYNLSEEQKKRLFQNKIDRAQAMIDSRDTVYFQIED
jgi:isopenicillin N synthase-like dioxygenase